MGAPREEEERSLWTWPKPSRLHLLCWNCSKEDQAASNKQRLWARPLAYRIHVFFFFLPPSNVGVTLQKARRRVEHHLTRIGFGKSRRQIISREVTPGECVNRCKVQVGAQTCSPSIRSEPEELAGDGRKRKRNVYGHSEGKENGFGTGNLRRNAPFQLPFGSLPARNYSGCKSYRCCSRFGYITIHSKYRRRAFVHFFSNFSQTAAIARCR